MIKDKMTPKDAAKEFCDQTKIPLGSPPGSVFATTYWRTRPLSPAEGPSDARTQAIVDAYHYYWRDLAEEQERWVRAHIDSAVRNLERTADLLRDMARRRKPWARCAAGLMDCASEDEGWLFKAVEFVPGPQGEYVFGSVLDSVQGRDPTILRLAEVMRRAARIAGHLESQAGGPMKLAKRGFIGALRKICVRERQLGYRRIALLWVAGDLDRDFERHRELRPTVTYRMKSVESSIRELIRHPLKPHVE